MALLKRSVVAMIVIMTALGVMLAGSACQQRTRASSFEGQPRAVLEALDVHDSRDPKLTVSSSGMLSLLSVYQDGSATRLGYAMSHDGGDHFMPLVPVSEAGANVSSHGENSPTLATTPTVIYALWEQTNPAGGTDLMVGRSVSYGRNFEKPVKVNDNSKSSFNGFSSLAVAPNGDVHVVWLDGRDDPATPGTFSVYTARSTDEGKTFGKNQRIATTGCPCCRPSMTFGPAGEVFVAWRKDFPGDIRDMVVSSSHDRGQTFSPEVRVADDGWHLSGCPDSGPAIAFTGNRLYVAWLTEGRERKSRVQVAWSDDKGSSFQAPIAVSGAVLDPNHPMFAASEDGRLMLVFQGRQNASGAPWNPSQPFVVELQAGQASEPQPLANGGATSSYPAIAAGTAGRVFVAWTQREDKASKVVMLRGRL